MGTAEDITEKLNAIQDLDSKIEAIAKTAIPLVEDHFNEYVKKTIDPRLNGYSLLPCSAMYTTRFDRPGFEITTGQVLTPDGGILKDPFPDELIILELCDEYKEQAPWVVGVDEGFELSK